MITYVKKIKSATIFAVIVIFFLFVLQKGLGYVNNIDCLSRLNLNSMYLANLYFLWTNLDYIYLYFIPIILIASKISMNLGQPLKASKVNISALIFMAFSLFNLQNLSVYVTSYTQVESTNLLLFNSLNKYHPFLLYYSVFALIVVTNSLGNASTLGKNANYNIFNTHWVLIKSAFTLFTIYLGSWWAYQEGSWGGWWAWDPSESLGLIIMLISVASAHYNYLYARHKFFYSFLSVACSLILLSYFFLQLNFGVTSHNFGLKDESSFIPKILYLLGASIALSRFIRHINKVAKVKVKNDLTTSKLRYFIWLAISIIALSALPLTTDLLWKILSINFININVNYTLLSAASLCAILQWSNLSKVLLTTTYAILFLSYAPMFLFIIVLLAGNSAVSNFSKVHNILISGLLISLSEDSYALLNWFDLVSLDEENLTNINLTLGFLELINQPFLINSNSKTLVDSTYSIICDFSTPNSSALFFLLNSYSNLSQSFVSDNIRIPLVSSTSDVTSYILNLAFYIIILFFVKTTKEALIIRC